MKKTNPKDALGTKKVPLSGMPAPVLLEAGLVKLHGDLKYGSYNWRDAGVRGSVYYDAAMRHLMAWWEGEDLDHDSGIHHLAHAITGLAVLRDSQIQNNWSDDRPSPTKAGWVGEFNVKAAQLIEKQLEKKVTVAAHDNTDNVTVHGIGSLQGVSPEPHTEAWDVLNDNPKFRSFLADNGCLQKWITNFDPQYSQCFSDSDVRSKLKAGFIWNNTPEGHKFWEELDDKWERRCK